MVNLNIRMSANGGMVKASGAYEINCIKPVGMFEQPKDSYQLGSQ